MARRTSLVISLVLAGLAFGACQRQQPEQAPPPAAKPAEPAAPAAGVASIPARRAALVRRLQDEAKIIDAELAQLRRETRARAHALTDAAHLRLDEAVDRLQDARADVERVLDQATTTTTAAFGHVQARATEALDHARRAYETARRQFEPPLPPLPPEAEMSPAPSS